MTNRYCVSCGCDLSRYNGSEFCGPCQRALIDGEILTNRGAAAEAVVEVYRHPDRFDSAQSYLVALTKYLNALCLSHGVESPSDIAEAFEVSTGGSDQLGEVLAEPPVEDLKVSA